MENKDEVVTTVLESAPVVQVTTPELLLGLLSFFQNAVERKKTNLELEDSGNVIAGLQGYIAGHRDMQKCLREAGYKDHADESIDPPWNEEDGCDLKLSQLEAYHLTIQEITSRDEWKALQDFMQKEVDAKKNMLFYRSDKGRDLYYCKGWYEAMSQIEEYMDRIEDFYQQALEERKQTLPFGELEA